VKRAVYLSQSVPMGNTVQARSSTSWTLTTTQINPLFDV